MNVEHRMGNNILKTQEDSSVNRQEKNPPWSRINRRGFLKTMGVGTMSVCLDQHLARAASTVHGGKAVPAGEKSPLSCR